ncbi:MAG: HNH endonuclease [bacterium]
MGRNYTSKKQRQIIKEKYNNRCAYSGTLLEDDWEVDHVIPIVHKTLLLENPDKVDNIKNKVPVQKLINHYKRGLSLEEFRSWYLGKLHERFKKLPKNPYAEKSINRKKYLQKIANYFGITPDKPFSGEFYFEKLKKDESG